MWNTTLGSSPYVVSCNDNSNSNDNAKDKSG